MVSNLLKIKIVICCKSVEQTYVDECYNQLVDKSKTGLEPVNWIVGLSVNIVLCNVVLCDSWD